MTRNAKGAMDQQIANYQMQYVIQALGIALNASRTVIVQSTDQIATGTSASPVAQMIPIVTMADSV
jgi:hypothetical protein